MNREEREALPVFRVVMNRPASTAAARPAAPAPAEPAPVRESASGPAAPRRGRFRAGRPQRGQWTPAQQPPSIPRAARCTFPPPPGRGKRRCSPGGSSKKSSAAAMCAACLSSHLPCRPRRRCVPASATACKRLAANPGSPPSAGAEHSDRPRENLYHRLVLRRSCPEQFPRPRSLARFSDRGRRGGGTAAPRRADRGV